MTHIAVGSAEAGSSAKARKVVPAINTITFADVRAALAAGFRDLKRAPTCGVIIGTFYVVGGVVLYALATLTGLFYLTYPLAAGFVLLGPFAAIALYEISRRLEAGEPKSIKLVAGVVFGTGGRSLGWMPMLNLFVFLIWVDVAAAIYLGFFGLHRVDLLGLVTEALTTPRGFIFLLVGNVIGAVFAILVFMTTVVSYPLLLDRDTDFITAIVTSWKAVRANPVPMLAFGFIVGLSTLLATVLGLVGLIIVLPVLGHATWHIYRRVVRWPEA